MQTHTKQKLTWFAVSAALVLGAVGVAAAKGGHDPAKRAAMMQRFDANGDGALDDAEKQKMKQAFAAKRAQREAARLARWDADQDGVLSPAERARAKDERARARFAELDTNRDGALSLDEFKAGQHRGGHRHRRGR